MASGGCFTVRHGNEHGRCATPRVLSALAGMGTAITLPAFPVAERLGYRLRFADAPCGGCPEACPRRQGPHSYQRRRASEQAYELPPSGIGR